MGDLGKLLMVVGLVLLVTGGALLLVAGLGWRIPLGRLPGDIHIRRDGWSLHVPLTTSLLVSIILSLLLTWIVRR